MREAVRAILINCRNALLLVQHNERDPNDQGKWSTVGGGIDRGEDHVSCLTRELEEEFCELVHVSVTDCANVKLSTGAAGMNGSAGVTQVILDVSMSFTGRSCSGAVWKTFQADGTWVLSSPTAIFGFPHTCDIP